MSDADPTTETESDVPTDRDATPEADSAADGDTSGGPRTAATEAPDDSPATDPPDSPGQRGLSDENATDYLYWGLLLGLGLLALLALFRFYGSASQAIAVWIAPRFEPVILAAFNLAVLLAAGIGISLVVRELND